MFKSKLDYTSEFQATLGYIVKPHFCLLKEKHNTKPDRFVSVLIVFLRHLTETHKTILKEHFHILTILLGPTEKNGSKQQNQPMKICL